MTPLDELKSKNTIPTSLISAYNKKIVTAEEAVRVIKSDDKIILQGGCAVPFALVNAMVNRKDTTLRRGNSAHINRGRATLSET